MTEIDPSSARRFDAPRHPPGAGRGVVGWAAVVAGIVLAAFAACISGLLGLGADAAGRAVAQAAERVAVRVVLSPTAPAANAGELATRLAALPAVRGVRVVPRDDAWRAMQSSWPAAGGANPLPDVLLVTLGLPAAGGSLQATADAVRQAAAATAGVDSVRVDRDWLGQVDRWRQAALDGRTPLLAAAVATTVLSSLLVWWLAIAAGRRHGAGGTPVASAAIAALAQAVAWLAGTAIAFGLMKSFGPATLYPQGLAPATLDGDVVVALVSAAFVGVLLAVGVALITDRKIATVNRLEPI